MSGLCFAIVSLLFCAACVIAVSPKSCTLYVLIPSVLNAAASLTFVAGCISSVLFFLFSISFMSSNSYRKHNPSIPSFSAIVMNSCSFPLGRVMS